MPTKPFKELERKDINQPDDMVTVSVVPPEGLSTNEGLKEQGETFEMPAKMARIHQQAGMVSIGTAHPGQEVDVRVEAHDQYWESRKAVEKAVEKAREDAKAENFHGNPEAVDGQAGLARADSGDPRMFSGSQTAAEERVRAINEGNREKPVKTAGESPSGRQAPPHDEVDSSAGASPAVPEEEKRQSSSEAKAGDDYESKSKEELVEEAKGRNLSHSNKNKGELVEALREDDREKE